VPVETIIVQLPVQPAAGAATQGVRRLRPGDRLTFGRGSADLAVDIVVSPPEVSRLAGEIEAADDFWLLTNYSHESTYVVENLEGGGEHVKVRPRRVRAPVPFEMARLVLPVAEDSFSLNVYAPQHSFVPVEPGRSGQTTMSPFSLDESAKYFQVLVALCEPRLRGESVAALPTVGEIVDRLAEPPHAGPSRAAVGYHIGYLCDEKLRIRERAGLVDSQRMEWKREALVSMALRFDLVREDHLALLPPRQRGANPR